LKARIAATSSADGGAAAAAGAGIARIVGQTVA
jgi:hypothetical protein